jgi:hypothetical protein
MTMAQVALRLSSLAGSSQRPAGSRSRSTDPPGLANGCVFLASDRPASLVRQLGEGAEDSACHGASKAALQPSAAAAVDGMNAKAGARKKPIFSRRLDRGDVGRAPRRAAPCGLGRAQKEPWMPREAGHRRHNLR